MKLIVGNDLHLGSKHATHTWEDFLDVIEVFPNTILNGDIFDFANCKRKDVELWKSRALQIKAIVEAGGGHYILGNHSLNQIDAPNHVIIDGVYITHGDYMFWSKEKADAYRNKKPGAGFLKRWITPVYDQLRHFADGGPNELFFKNADKIIEQYKPRAIVVGHRHPKENIIFDYKGVRCYILKRGIQEIEI